MPKAADLKKGAIVEIDDQLYLTRNIDVRSPSSRGANTLYKVTFMNIQKKQKLEQTFSGTDFLKDADILVSDYSSMVFESLYLSKPVVLFCPDYETYRKNSREFYIDPCKDLPVKISYTQDELMQKLLLLRKERKFDTERFKSFKPYAIQDKLLKKLVEKAHEKG